MKAVDQSSNIPGEPAYYAAMPAARRGELAHEMMTEVMEHFAQVEAIVSSAVTHLRARSSDDLTALRLATVAEAWMMDREHVAQMYRLLACLEAQKEASHA